MFYRVIALLVMSLVNAFLVVCSSLYWIEVHGALPLKTELMLCTLAGLGMLAAMKLGEYIKE